MSFFERFRGKAPAPKESAHADHVYDTAHADLRSAMEEHEQTRKGLGSTMEELKQTKENFEVSLVDAENLDLLREKEELKVELEMQDILGKDEKKTEQISKRIQEIDTFIQNEKDAVKQRLSK